MRNLMQGSVKDFSISIVKNIPQNNYWDELWKKTSKTKDIPLRKSNIKWGKRRT